MSLPLPRWMRSLLSLIVFILAGMSPAWADDQPAASFSALTGLVSHPSAEVQGMGHGILSISYRDDDNTGSFEWIEIGVAGVGLDNEIGVFFNERGDKPSSILGGSIKHVFYKSPELVKLKLQVAGWGVYRSKKGEAEERIGLTATQQLPWHLLRSHGNLSLSGGVMYVSAPHRSLNSTSDSQVLDYYLGARAPLFDNWVVEVDWEPENNDLQGESWSELLRYDAGRWLIQGGYQSREDPFLGVQFRF